MRSCPQFGIDQLIASVCVDIKFESSLWSKVFTGKGVAVVRIKEPQLNTTDSKEKVQVIIPV